MPITKLELSVPEKLIVVYEEMAPQNEKITYIMRDSLWKLHI